MSDTTFLLMAFSVLLSSVALVVFAIAAVGIFQTVRKLQRDIEPLIPQTMKTLRSAEIAMVETVGQVRELSEKAHTVLAETQEQLEAFKSAREEVSTRLRVQAERAELVLEDVLTRIQEVVSTMHNGVMRPVREVSGVMAGIKTAFSTLLQNRRPSVAQVTHDEEMFI